MAKKVGIILMAIFVVSFLGINLYNFFWDRDSTSPTGSLITDLPLGLNMSVLAFVLQWVILLVVVIFAYTRFLKHRKEEDAKIAGLVLPKLTSKSQTYMDVFYNLLKEKKSLSIRSVSILFNIKKDKAMEWAKILEDHDLVIIEYPAFSDPEVKIKEGKMELDMI